MTLIEIVKAFENIAKKQPNINYVGNGDIYSLNSLPNIDYSVFFITQTEHQQSENTIKYNLILYYVDRLLKDGDNTLNVQSTGILQLQNIINIFNQLNDEVEIDYDINYTTFTHRFTDDCAGVFCSVSITADADTGICGY